MLIAAREGEDPNNESAEKVLNSVMAILTNPNVKTGADFEEALTELVKTSSAIPFFKLLVSEPSESPFTPAKLASALHDMLSDLRGPGMTLAKWINLMRRFDDRVSFVMRQRRLFRLDERLLGIGPAHLEKGDQVWILAGAGSPYVLRAVYGLDNVFRLVGQSYVYGMMEGEGLRLGRDLSDIVLQ